MKRMKRVAPAAAGGIAMESSPTSPYATLYEDPRTRLKHQTLMQDFAELYRETEDQRKKLQIMKQKKLTLLAEVRFLRQRYKHLMLDQSQSPAPEPKSVQKHNLVSGSGTRNVRKERHYKGNDAALQYPALKFDLHRKGKIHSEREPTLQRTALNFDTNQKHKTSIRKEVAMRNTAAIPDLNQKERIYSGKEATVGSNTPIFDLNQISREEEELQANGEAMRIEDPKICFIRGGSDEQHTDMKLSACRGVGNGPSRAGKRKISWQDQVALRV